jgi:hypothetical protein
MSTEIVQHTHSLSISIEDVISQDDTGIVVPKSTSGESDNVEYVWCASILYPHGRLLTFSEEEDGEDGEGVERDTVVVDG